MVQEAKRDRRSKRRSRNNHQTHHVFIHGANQSRVCWNYVIRELELTKDQYTHIEYTSLEPFQENLDRMLLNINSIPENSCFIGHSLGGIYALHLYKNHPEKFGRGITISTPFGGSSAPDYLKYISPSTRLFRDIGRRSLPITLLTDVKIEIPDTDGDSSW